MAPIWQCRCQHHFLSTRHIMIHTRMHANITWKYVAFCDANHLIFITGRERVRGQSVHRPQCVPTTCYNQHGEALFIFHLGVGHFVCGLNSLYPRQIQPSVTRTFWLLDNVRLCMDMFNCDVIGTLLAKRKQKFLSGFVHWDSILNTIKRKKWK